MMTLVWEEEGKYHGTTLHVVNFSIYYMSVSICACVRPERERAKTRRYEDKVKVIYFPFAIEERTERIKS